MAIAELLVITEPLVGNSDSDKSAEMDCSSLNETRSVVREIQAFRRDWNPPKLNVHAAEGSREEGPQRLSMLDKWNRSTDRIGNP